MSRKNAVRYAAAWLVILLVLGLVDYEHFHGGSSYPPFLSSPHISPEKRGTSAAQATISAVQPGPSNQSSSQLAAATPTGEQRGPEAAVALESFPLSLVTLLASAPSTAMSSPPSVPAPPAEPSPSVPAPRVGSSPSVPAPRVGSSPSVPDAPPASVSPVVTSNGPAGASEPVQPAQGGSSSSTANPAPGGDQGSSGAPTHPTPPPRTLGPPPPPPPPPASHPTGKGHPVPRPNTRPGPDNGSKGSQPPTGSPG
jgi:hypothetical protein